MKKRLTILFAAAALMLALGAGVALANDPDTGPEGVNRVGTNGPDRLVGTAQSDVLRGLGGNDVLIGRGDSDRLFGGAGNDRIDATDPGRPEGDLVNCGPGFDRVSVDPGTEDVVAANCEQVTVVR